MPSPGGEIGPTLPTLGARLRERGGSWGGFVLTIDRTDSTNQLAAAFARRGAPHGAVFLALEQHGGRGRWNRRWESPRGGLYATIVIRSSDVPTARLEILPLVAAVAAAEAIERASGLRVELRWPNDLFFDRRKVGGILCESSFAGARLEFALVGVGINLHPNRGDFSQEVAERAGSLQEATGRVVEPLDLATELVLGLENGWETGTTEDVVSSFRARAPRTEGARVRVECREGESYECTTSGIAVDGALKVKLDDGSLRVLRSDDVHLLDD